MSDVSQLCGSCGARLRVPEGHRGQRLACPRCGVELPSPGAGGVAPTGSSAQPAAGEGGPTLAHACAGCGAVLTVRERHFGRRLRCPRCSTEFELSRDAWTGALGSGATTSEETPAEAGEAAATRQPAPVPPAPEPVPPVRPAPTGDSYTHVCSACGAEMRVHARYFGRTLRCTSCRVEFDAVPQSQSAAAPQTPVMAAAPASGRRVWRFVAAAAAVVAVVGGVVGWLGGDRTRGLGSELFRPERTRTDLAVLRSGDDQWVTVAIDRDTVQELLAAERRQDQATLTALGASHRCLQVAAGTQVRVLERRKRASEASVRVLEGQWTGRIVWVSVDAIW